jgi:hypothetical protein
MDNRLMEASEVLLRYATAIDTKDWKLFRTCFSDDCRTVYDDRTIDGADHLTSYMERVHRYLDGSLHRMSNIVVTHSGVPSTDGRRTAFARSYVDAILVRRDSQAGAVFHVVGEYRDVLVTTPAGWALQERRYRTVWSEGNRDVSR